MLCAIQNGMKLLAADEIKRLNQRIEARRARMASLRTMQQILRQRHNKDLRQRSELLEQMDGRLADTPPAAAGFDDVALAIDQRSRDEEEAMNDINDGGDDNPAQFDAGGEA